MSILPKGFYRFCAIPSMKMVCLCMGIWGKCPACVRQCRRSATLVLNVHQHIQQLQFADIGVTLWTEGQRRKEQLVNKVLHIMLSQRVSLHSSPLQKEERTQALPCLFAPLRLIHLTPPLLHSLVLYFWYVVSDLLMTPSLDIFFIN